MADVTNEREFIVYAIYEKPTDYPDKFVLRAFRMSGEISGFTAERECKLADSIDEIRKFLPPGLYRLNRNDCDVISLVETWL
jgi:hypothetical protein